MHKTLCISAVIFLAACQADTSSTPAVTVAAAPSVNLSSLIVGKTVSTGSAQIIYAADGSYSYTAGGRTDRGAYKVNGDTVCVTFPSGFKRCDRYINSGGTYYLVIKVA